MSPDERRGWIVPVGGAEDKEGRAEILRRFIAVAGEAEARIAVIPTASQLEDTGRRYEKLFKDLGARDAVVVPYKTRSDATREDWLKSLETSTGIFLTGGNQLRISTVLGGTPVAKAIRRLNAQGVTVGGTSAGAAILSEHMIAYGDEGAHPKAGMATLAPGFGMTNRVIIDQHFRQRDRLGRLLSAMAYNPFAVGLGLDEDTAAFIDPDDRVHVVGAGSITVIDASQFEYSSISAIEIGQPICMIGIHLHMLTAGCTFDLHSRRATPPQGSEV
ncbi:MAG TPA: cyanophycinase [Kofleriaceae bacterium]|nr:cyanophycinase [Kofleriaceae bacterium]